MVAAGNSSRDTQRADASGAFHQGAARIVGLQLAVDIAPALERLFRDGH